MKVYTNGQFNKDGGCVLALGSFDALHRAHIKLIDTAVCEAKKRAVKSGVHMFFGRIENVIFPNANHKSIYTDKMRMDFAEQTGVDFAYFESFDEEFMNIEPFDFAKMLKDKFGVVCVVAGYDYTFGRKGAADVLELEKFGKILGFDVVVIDAIKYEGELVSSSKIREYIKNGDIESANALLGRDYSLCANVVSDRGVGRKMGVPTANLSVPGEILLAKNGVYGGYTVIDGKKYVCVINIGIRPTFELENICVEVHIIDFDKDIYGRELCVYFKERIRDEKKFATKEQLTLQILDDIDKARKYF